jgi:hypothetical protein
MSDQYTPTGGQTIFPRINYLKTFSSRLEQRIRNGRVAMFFKRLFGDATLDIDFAGTKSIGDKLTFTRASAALYRGSDGLIKTSPVNLLSFSEQFDQWSAGSSSIITPDNATAPDGTLTADQVYFSRSGGTNVSQSITLTQNQTYTFSVYAKAATPGTNNKFAPYIGSLTPRFPDDFEATSEWQRFVFTFTHTDTTGSTGTFLLNKGDEYITNVYLWGAQLEEGTAVTDYIPTGTSISGAPRFDHDPVTGESLGLLIEEESTNLIHYSEPDSGTPDVSNTNGNWNFQDLNRNTEIDKVEGPDGVSNSASRMQLASGSQWDLYVRINNLTAGEKCTFSGWVRLGTATNFALHVNNTSGWDTVADGVYSFDASDGLNTTSFVKISHTFTAPTGSKVNVHIGRHLGTAPAQQTTGTVDVWGLQIERKSFATSTIRTSGADVTRAADVASITGTNFSSWYNQGEGSFVVKADRYDALPATKFNVLTTNGFRLPEFSFTDTGNAVIYATNTTNYTSPAPLLKASFGWSFDSTGVSKYINGVGSTTTESVTDTNTALYLGTHLNTAHWHNGHISRFAYFPTRKTDQELTDLTT